MPDDDLIHPHRPSRHPGAGRSSLALLLAVLLGVGAGYGIALWRGAGHPQNGPGAAAPAAAPMPGAASSPAQPGGRTVLYWFDPMKPDARFDKPGRSPFMDMDLVPRYADEGGAGGVAISPVLTQSLGMRLAPVRRETFTDAIDATGTLGFNERDVAVQQTRSAGFVEKVYARAPGDVVAAGAPLVDVLVPEWAGAQREFLAVRATGDSVLTDAARQRLRLLGMDEALIDAVERSGQPRPVLTLASPIGGVIQELMVRQGMALAPMMTLARINGLGTLWLEVAVPEVHARQLQVGRAAQARFVAFAGEVFHGRIAAVLPEASRETRTLRVRIELPNRGGRLRAGLYAQATLAGAAETALVVPAAAVIRTGRRAVVFVAGDEAGRFQPQKVELGREVGERIVVLKGLAEGQRVVVSGPFLVDSEASLSGALSRSAAAPELHEVDAVVESVDGGEITVDHAPVPALKWPQMVMPFALKTPALAQGLKAGDRVRLRFAAEGAGPVVHEIRRQQAPAGAGAQR